MALATLAFLLGRWSAPVDRPELGAAPGGTTTSSAAASGAASPGELSGLACPPAKGAGTSTLTGCPCPIPKARRPASLSLTRRPAPPSPPPAHQRPDPTAKTAAHLRARAEELAECAPASGLELRVHLEITVAPAGRIEDVRVTNLDPLPAQVASCVLERVQSFDPPGFDASSAEIFALTVVL